VERVIILKTDVKGERCVLVIAGSKRHQCLVPVNTSTYRTGYSFAENIGFCFFCEFILEHTQETVMLLAVNYMIIVTLNY
jgi:hypothetical protein